jgi:uncharacterized iron-regulated membrane protein
VHRAGSLWFWVISGALAISSVALNLHNEVFRPVVNLFAPMTPHPVTRVVKLPAPNFNPPIDHDGAVRLATAALPPQSRDLTANHVGYGPEYGIYRVGFDHADRASALFRVRYQHVYIDGVTGAVVAHNGTDTGTAGDTFAAMQFPIHSGQILGMAGRIVVCVSGIVIAIFAGTGVYIWWRKRRARRLLLAEAMSNEPT